MVELVDTLVSGTSSRKAVEVQVFSWALEEPESQDFGSFLFLAHHPVVKEIEWHNCLMD